MCACGWWLLASAGSDRRLEVEGKRQSDRNEAYPKRHATGRRAWTRRDSHLGHLLSGENVHDRDIGHPHHLSRTSHRIHRQTRVQGGCATPTWGTAFVSGMIVLWSGATNNIPTGFVICNGSNSTPDLRNRFVVGAGDTYAVDATGGSANATLPTHNHSATSSVTDPGHFHNVLPRLSGAFSNTGAFIQTATTAQSQSGVGNTDTKTTGISVATSIANAGSSGTNANLPPYYSLAYIMKT